MSVRMEDLLFLGTHGHVLALSKDRGRVVWDRSLPDTGYSIVTLLFEDGRLFAGSRGHVFALDPTSGEILWKNGLRGLGHGHMVLATVAQGTDPAPLQQELDDEASQHPPHVPT